MKNKLLLMVVVVLTMVLLIEIKTPKKEIQNNKNDNNQEEIKVKNIATGAIETKDLENYVAFNMGNKEKAFNYINKLDY